MPDTQRKSRRSAAQEHYKPSPRKLGSVSRNRPLSALDRAGQRPGGQSKWLWLSIGVVALLCSGLEHQNTADIPAEEAGETMPDAEGPLVGMQSDVDGPHSPGQ